jgi:VPDSG-CTERM motif
LLLLKEEKISPERNIPMKNLTKTLLAVLAAGLVTTSLSTQEAQAAQIHGRLDLAGSVMFDSSALQNVNQVNQWRDINGNIGFSNVAAFNGSYVGHVVLGQQVTMSGGNSFPAWVFNPSTPTPALWSVGGFTFDLTSATIVTQNAMFLNVSGVGTVSGNGFDVTNARWAFTVQNAGGGTGDFFSFSANTASVVPDGGSAVALLGISLVAIEFVRRKLRSRA